jgi:outer membrane murein-binding lipoprotein Lpp
MRRLGGTRRAKASHQSRGHRMDHRHGRSPAVGRSADRSHRMTVVAAVLAAVVVAGCGSSDGNGSGGSTPVAHTSAQASASTSSSGADVEVTIAAGKVAPDPSRKVEVATGDHVHIRVTSDHADEVHVHGYDIEKEVSAGGTVTIDFTADVPGQFEVEAHRLSPPLLFTLVVH